MMKKIKDQNFQIVFSAKGKATKLPWGAISSREKGTMFPWGEGEYVSLRRKGICSLVEQVHECLSQNYMG
jgi:hypothetical protein